MARLVANQGSERTLANVLKRMAVFGATGKTAAQGYARGGNVNFMPGAAMSQLFGGKSLLGSGFGKRAA